MEDTAHNQTIVDLYDTGKMIHRSKTGTELAVGYHKLTGETVVIKAMDASKFPKKQLQAPTRAGSRTAETANLGRVPWSGRHWVNTR